MIQPVFNNSIKFLLYVSIYIVGITNTQAQNYFYKTYTWEKQPSAYKPAPSEQHAELILVKDFTNYETAYDKDGQAVVFETRHFIYHANTQKGIEEINKVYIPTSQVNEEVDLNARCITVDNKVIPFNSDNVKRVDNLDNNGPYTIFSLDGVDIGCDVEYYYTNKRTFYPYAFFKVHNSLPIKHYECQFLSPKNLIYESKSYNGLAQAVKDTSDKNKNCLRIVQNNIEAVEEEKYSTPNANKMSFLLQLAYNTDKSNAKFYTWETLAKGYYNSVFTIEKADQKIIDKFVDKNKINKPATADEKIFALETALKLEYNISDEAPELPLAKAIEQKQLSKVDALRIYAGAFKTLQIPFELVLTSNRLNKKFDGKQPSSTYLEDILFYFPNSNKYTSPLEILSRIDFPDPNNLANDALFIKEIMLGDIGAPSSKVKTLPTNDYTKSYHNLSLKASINPSSLVATLNVTQYLMGYSAYYIQPIYALLNDEQKKEANKSYYTVAKPDLTKNTTVTNTEKEVILSKPFQVSYTQELPDVIESAGDKFIFKVGELIGEQSQLYQDKKRVSDADIYFTHYLKRDMEIEIPEGYKITNANDLKIDKRCVMDGKDMAQFVSDYKIEGNKIIITLYEDYRAMKYPLDAFEGFKSVINAAADFNKKTLVFEKK